MKTITLIEQKFNENKNLIHQKFIYFDDIENAKKELKRIKKILNNTPTFKIKIDGEQILSFQNLTEKYNFIITKI